MSRGMKFAVGLVLLASTMACSHSSTSPAPTTVTATIMSGAISPTTINISAGSTVTWMNKDTTAHSLVADGGAFNSGAIAPDGQFSYTFPVAGTFTYHDPSNGNVNGTVNVSSTGMAPY